MLRTTLKSILLLLSIGLINSGAYAIAQQFHTPYGSTISSQQFAAYENSMQFLIVFMALAILIVELLHDRWHHRNELSTLLYGAVLCLALYGTLDQLHFRPYEHGLTLASCASVVISRLLLNRWLGASGPKRVALARVQ